MSDIWSVIAFVLEAIAKMGAGAASGGIGFEPDLPKELRR